MSILEVTDGKYKAQWDKLVRHPMQSWEWGEFREKTGVRVARYGVFTRNKFTLPAQVTIHPIPHTPWTIGYYPKGSMPLNAQTAEVLQKIAKQYACVYIKCEPKIEVQDSRFNIQDLRGVGFVPGRPLFTKYNFVLDVTPSEEDLLKNMKQKTRYNIRVAEKRGVTVAIDDSPLAFERYLELTTETTKRQGFYAHTPAYHRKMWETLHNAGIAHILTAKYEGEIITAWILFRFGNTLYYPYGASTREHREVMANNLVMWEAIRLAKLWGLQYLDMWGALGVDADPHDPWYGFHTFKLGYGARHAEYMGTWDYVANPFLYPLIRTVEEVRWKLLHALR